MTDIILGNVEFKALASETRSGIIKLLNERNYTLSEISKKMELAAPTIKQHLALLEGAGLIQQMDEGRKWKYYSLTKKGIRILNPEAPTNVLIILGLSVIGFLGVFYSLFSRISMQTMVLTAPVNKQINDLPLLGKAAESITEDALAVAPATAVNCVAEAAPVIGRGIPLPEVVALVVAGIALLAITLIFMPTLFKKKKRSSS